MRRGGRRPRGKHQKEGAGVGGKEGVEDEGRLTRVMRLMQRSQELGTSLLLPIPCWMKSSKKMNV